MAHDEWDKQGDRYTYEHHPEAGGSISKQGQGSSIKTVKSITKPMTRAEVEEALRD
jgi:hypothetical protein